jgi:hypothetical protein
VTHKYERLAAYSWPLKADIEMEEEKQRFENVKLTLRACSTLTYTVLCAASLSFKVQMIFLVLCSSARLVLALAKKPRILNLR